MVKGLRRQTRDKRAAVLFRVKKGWGSLRLKRPKARLSTPVRVKRTASGVETEKIVVAAGETWTWRPEEVFRDFERGKGR